MLKNTFKSELVRNTSILVSGNVIGQGVAFLAQVLLARIYSEEDFGVFSLFSTVVAILVIFATGKYEEAIVLAKNRKESLLLTGFVFKILTIFSVLLFLLLLLFRHSVFPILNMELLTDYWYLIPPTVFFTGVSYILMDIATRKRQFKSIASSNLSFSSISSSLKLLLGYASFTGIGLMLSNLIAQILACFSFHKLKKEVIIALSGKWKEQKQVGIRHKDFPKYSMTRNLVNSLSTGLPFLLLTGFFGGMELGLYAMAVSMGMRPATTIYSSAYQVFYEKVAGNKNRNQRIFPVLKKYWIRTTLILLPVFTGLYFISPYLFGFVLGQKWEMSGVYFGYLLPLILISIVLRPMLFIPALFSRQNKALVLEIICLVLRCIVIYIGIYLDNFKLAIFLYSLTGTAVSVFTLFWYVFLVKKYERGLALSKSKKDV